MQITATMGLLQLFQGFLGAHRIQEISLMYNGASFCLHINLSKHDVQIDAGRN